MAASVSAVCQGRRSTSDLGAVFLLLLERNERPDMEPRVSHANARHTTSRALNTKSAASLVLSTILKRSSFSEEEEFGGSVIRFPESNLEPIAVALAFYFTDPREPMRMRRG